MKTYELNSIKRKALDTIRVVIHCNRKGKTLTRIRAFTREDSIKQHCRVYTHYMDFVIQVQS
jgi:translation initiation factor 1 (eIF-1/SUI1)